MIDTVSDSALLSLSERPPLIAEVAVDGARLPRRNGTLSYAITPAHGENDRIAIGQLVWVPLRRQFVLGIVTHLHNDPVSYALKAIHAPVEPAFHLSEDRLAIARWLARETATSLFAAASPFLPPGVNRRAVEYLRLIMPFHGAPTDVTAAQGRLLALLDERGETSLVAARAALGSSLTSVVAKLEARGLIERVARVTHGAPHPRLDRFVRLIVAADPAACRSPRQRAVVDYLVQRSRLAPVGGDGLVRLSEVVARTGTDRSVLGALAQKGLVEEIALPRSIGRPDHRGAGVPALTTAQARAWTEVESALERRDPTPFLLHGVTGSGKTEVYLRAVGWCLRHERAAIVLVPEIALASQVVRRFTNRFPGQVAVLHSALSDAERYAAWQGVASGRTPIVVGPRSALFAPVDDLGLIVLDEEHDSAYKQEGEPRYHARALAEHLAAMQGAVVMLGSATPSIETAWRADQRGSGQLHRLELRQRVAPRLDGDPRDGQDASLELPAVDVVDMRLELHRGNTSLFSERLQALLHRTLARKEQAILFLNRRGLATIVLCRSCGEALICPFCDVPLVFHADRGRLLCHRCNHREIPPTACACGGQLNYFGAGTQRVEDEVRRLMPGARVLRWDQDAVRGAGGHERMLRRVEHREVDVVVGTQMIAKGLDLPHVTAIGVVHADTMLHLPDFRSAERTFQLLTQVAGRAGRRTAGSRVVVQTYTPAHYAIQAAARHDYAAFFAEEIDFRRMHRYPPFTRLIRYLFRGPDDAQCAAESDEMARLIARHARASETEIDLLGPTPAFASRVRGKYQWQIVVRGRELESLLESLPIRPGWTIDVDPQSLL
jgi:primosomal protein N' (replication factor Y)